MRSSLHSQVKKEGIVNISDCVATVSLFFAIYIPTLKAYIQKLHEDAYIFLMIDGKDFFLSKVFFA
jgi:hypothetical protein